MTTQIDLQNPDAAVAMAAGDLVLVTRPSGPDLVGAPLSVLLAPGAIHGLVGDGVTDNLTNLQAYLTAQTAAGTGGTVFIPAGRYIVSAALAATLTGNMALLVQGQGADITELVFTNDTDGLTFTYASQASQMRDTATGCKVFVRNLSIVRAVATAGHAALTIIGDSQNASGVPEPQTRIWDVTFRGTTAGGGWASNIIMQDIANTDLRSLAIFAPGAAAAGGGALVQSGSGVVIRTTGSRYSTLHAMDSVNIQGCLKCLDIGQRVQGVEIVNSNLIGGTGIGWNSVGRQEQLSVVNTEFSCVIAGIDVFNLQNVQVSNSTFYSQRAYPQPNGTPGPYVAINLAETDTCQIVGNGFSGSYLAGEHAIHITNDDSLVTTGRVTGGPNSVAMMAPGIEIVGNGFTNFYGDAIYLSNNTRHILVAGNSFDNIAQNPPINLSAGTQASCASNQFAGVLYLAGFPGSGASALVGASATTFTAAPTFPTPAPGDNSTSGATTAFIAAAVAGLVQNGSGIGQNPLSMVKLGWSTGTAKLKATVDLTDEGNIALETWVTAQLAGFTPGGGGTSGPLAVTAVSTTGSTMALPFTTGARETSYAITLTQNCTFTPGAAPAGEEQLMTVDLIQSGAGGFVPSFSGIAWAGGVAPTFNTVPTKRDTIQIRASGSEVSAYPVSMARVPLIPALPAAPSSITLTPGVNQITINAAAVAAYPATTGYTIWRSLTTGTEGTFAPIASNVTLPYVDTGRATGTTYFYIVAAVNALGSGPASAESSTAPIAPPVPAAPGTPTVTPGNNQNTVTVAAVTASPAVTGYTIKRGTTAGGESSTPIATNVAVPYVDTTAVNGTNYFYVVGAVNSNGTGAYSPEASGQPAAPALPAAPGAPTITPGNNQNSISVPPVTAVPAVTGYTIYRGTAAGGESGTALATNVAIPYIDSTAVNGTAYFYKAAAVNANGTGAQSPEGSGTPVAPGAANSAHYAVFSNINQAIYASPNAAFNPGASAFDMRAHVNMANYTTGTSIETNLWGCWDAVTPAMRLWRLGLTTDGRIRASWATSATVFPTATSASVISATGGNDLWLRAVVTPTTGNVAFYTSTDGASWTALGASQTASSSGAVYIPSSLPYMVIAQNASGGSAAAQEQFIGRFIEAQLLIAGTLTTDPLMTSGNTVDSKGFAYSTSSGVTYV